MEYYVLKPTISNERYEKILEYNRNYYADMSVERKAEYIEMKKLYNRRYREQKKLEKELYKSSQSKRVGDATPIKSSSSS